MCAQTTETYVKPNDVDMEKAISKLKNEKATV
jgi:hypothetical protein